MNKKKKYEKEISQKQRIRTKEFVDLFFGRYRDLLNFVRSALSLGSICHFTYFSLEHPYKTGYGYGYRYRSKFFCWSILGKHMISSTYKYGMYKAWNKTFAFLQLEPVLHFVPGYWSHVRLIVASLFSLQSQ